MSSSVVKTSIALSFTLLSCVLSGLTNISPIFVLRKINLNLLTIDQIPSLMFIAFYVLSIFLFALSLGKRIQSKTVLTVENIENWSSLFSFFISLLSNISVFAFFMKQKLDYLSKNFLFKPVVVGIILIPIIITLVVLAIIIFGIKEFDYGDAIITAICTIFVSISPINNIRNAVKYQEAAIIPYFTLITSASSHLLWTSWMIYKYFNETNKKKIIIFGCGDFLAFLINLIMIIFYYYLYKRTKNLRENFCDLNLTSIIEEKTISDKYIS